MKVGRVIAIIDGQFDQAPPSSRFSVKLAEASQAQIPVG